MTALKISPKYVETEAQWFALKVDSKCWEKLAPLFDRVNQYLSSIPQWNGSGREKSYVTLYMGIGSSLNECQQRELLDRVGLAVRKVGSCYIFLKNLEIQQCGPYLTLHFSETETLKRLHKKISKITKNYINEQGLKHYERWMNRFKPHFTIGAVDLNESEELSNKILESFKEKVYNTWLKQINLEIKDCLLLLKANKVQFRGVVGLEEPFSVKKHFVLAELRSFPMSYRRAEFLFNNVIENLIESKNTFSCDYSFWFSPSQSGEQESCLIASFDKKEPAQVVGNFLEKEIILILNKDPQSFNLKLAYSLILTETDLNNLLAEKGREVFSLLVSQYLPSQRPANTYSTYPSLQSIVKASLSEEDFCSREVTQLTLNSFIYDAFEKKFSKIKK